MELKELLTVKEIAFNSPELLRKSRTEFKTELRRRLGDGYKKSQDLGHGNLYLPVGVVNLVGSGISMEFVVTPNTAALQWERLDHKAFWDQLLNEVYHQAFELLLGVYDNCHANKQ